MKKRKPANDRYNLGVDKVQIIKDISNRKFCQFNDITKMITLTMTSDLDRTRVQPVASLSRMYEDKMSNSLQPK